ncbi:MAG TPA: Ig-like domain-containing protein [Candidatus Ozemobacteraceae bacterium]|nr:Ig-like domain-containing protein [Candidatus Ozemobacteraceae bacterium]
MAFLSSYRIHLFALLVVVTAILFGGCTNANSVAALRTTDGAETALTDTETTSGTGGNLSPMLNLTSGGSLTGFGGEITLTADAIDPDGDPVQLNWTASGGTIIRNVSNSAVWKAPSMTGTFEITCSADDRKGGITTKKTSVDVVGGRIYAITVQINRTSLLVNPTSAAADGDWLPLAQAKVTIPALDLVGITNAQGKTEIALDAGNLVASSAEVRIQYLDWDLRYTAVFPSNGTSISDNIQLHPGFENASVAVGRGDSFTKRRGGVEVQVLETVAGVDTPLNEAAITVGTNQQVTSGGAAFLAVGAGSGDTVISVVKSGYAERRDMQIPVALDGLTIVRMRLYPAHDVPVTDPIISWTRPYNGQTGVDVSTPLEIGFGQSMDTATIFDQFELTLEIDGKTTVAVPGSLVKSFFEIEWIGATVLRLKPRQALSPSKKYSLMLSQWGARAADGRLLRNYTGLFASFTTAADPSPHVVSTSPKNGDTGVSRAGPFRVKFDRPMNPASLLTGLRLDVTDMQNGIRVTLDGTALGEEFDIAWSDDDTILSLVPNRTLASNRSYLIRLTTSGLRSRSGLALAGEAQLWCQFTTGTF